jgi:hypothetical protein
MASTRFRRDRRAAAAVVALVVSIPACSGTATDADPAGSPTQATASPSQQRELDGRQPMIVGEPIDIRTLEGKVVFDDFEDVYVMRADGSHVRPLTDRPGSEFDGAWAPNGRHIVYRDSRRGINENDEIYIANADGSATRNLTRDPANDWGPDWSPDGTTIVFNSDRDGGMGGFLMSPHGSRLRRIQSDAWIEHPAFSPDGTRIVFMGHAAGDTTSTSRTSPPARRHSSPTAPVPTGGPSGRLTGRRSRSRPNVTIA